MKICTYTQNVMFLAQNRNLQSNFLGMKIEKIEIITPLYTKFYKKICIFIILLKKSKII